MTVDQAGFHSGSKGFQVGEITERQGLANGARIGQIASERRCAFEVGMDEGGREEKPAPTPRFFSPTSPDRCPAATIVRLSGDDWEKEECYMIEIDSVFTIGRFRSKSAKGINCRSVVPTRLNPRPRSTLVGVTTTERLDKGHPKAYALIDRALFYAPSKEAMAAARQAHRSAR